MEYVIVDNPPAGTYRLKAVPWSAPYSSNIPVGIAAVVIRGDLTPGIDLIMTGAGGTSVRVGETFVIWTEAESQAYVASGVHLFRDALPFGVYQKRWEIFRPDGVTMDFVGHHTTERFTLGNIPQGVGVARSVEWTFQAIAPGTWTIAFEVASEHGRVTTADAVVSVLPACQPDAFEPDDSAGEASVITLGSQQAHSMCPYMDYDWVTFRLAEPSSVKPVPLAMALAYATGRTSGNRVRR